MHSRLSRRMVLLLRNFNPSVFNYYVKNIGNICGSFSSYELILSVKKIHFVTKQVKRVNGLKMEVLLY